MRYNYYEAMKNDINDYISDMLDYFTRDCTDVNEVRDNIYDTLWAVDWVTGNASGSYTFCRQTAKEHVLDNVDLLKEAYEEFCCKNQFADDFFSENWEKMDVTIRCYILGCVLDEWMEENNETVESALA